MLPELLRYRRNVNSQAGEDGVLAEILRRLEINRGWFCEFGAWDGMYLSNTYLLLEQGWQGVMIEGDRKKFVDLERTSEKFPGHLFPICHYVAPTTGPDSLDSLLKSTPIPSDFDVLSVDVDGLDYFIWESFQGYKPKVVIIEVNSHYPPGVDHLENGGNAHASFTSMLKLGAKKGYTPLLHTGNVIFIRSDLERKISTASATLKDWTNQFQYTSKSAEGSLSRRWSRFRQRLTNRFLYSHLRQGHR